MTYRFDQSWKENDPEFLSRVDGWILAAVPGDNTTLTSLLRALPGVYPGEALASLHRLDANGFLPAGLLSRVLRDVARRPAPRRVDSEPHSGVRLEHPLDYEWVFSHQGKEAILDEIDHLAEGKTWTVLSMGCPSVFRLGSDSRRHKFQLLDKNAAAWGQLSEAQLLTNIDLVHGEIPAMEIDAAVVDPPWYNEFYKLFIWSATMLLRTGGKILLSVPQEGTRPSCLQDLAAISSWCQEVGLAEIARHRGRLSYRAPLFELNALRAQGLYNVPFDWRRSDLWVLEKRSSVVPPRPCLAVVPDLWREHRFGPVRFKVGPTAESASELRLRALIRNGIVPSVSSRYPGRPKANFVTSGNRFFVANSPEKLSALLSEFAGANAAGNQLDRNQLARIELRLLRLIQLEQREAEGYLASVHDV
jgi:hypothetical protein